MSKPLNDIEASFSVIASSIKNYYAGINNAYLPVAVELRKLLCDTQQRKDNSLLKRIFSGFRLRPLCGAQDRVDQYTTLYIPGRIRSDGKGSIKIEQLINENAPSLAIEEWLTQKLIDDSITIRDLIRSVADKEGAHSDAEYNETLKKAKSVRLSEAWSLCDQCIIIIGRYLIKALAIWMLNNDLLRISQYILNQYTIIGRGCAILNLFDFALHISKGFCLDYRDKDSFISMVNGDAEKCYKFMQTIESYRPSEVFLLLVNDINGEFWLYEQRIKKGSRPHSQRVNSPTRLRN